MIALLVLLLLAIVMLGYSLWCYIYYWELPVRNFDRYHEEE